MYVYKVEEEKTRKERILDLLSFLFYGFAVAILVIAGVLGVELHPGWVIVPLALFVVATFLGPLVTQKSWRTLTTLIAAIYLCFTFVLDLFRPDLSTVIVATINSILGWLLIVTLLIGKIFIFKRKIERRVSDR